MKEIQAKYQTNPEVMQREMQLLYSENDVNPLAGCFPALVQIPVFIGLYRALLKLASDDLLNEPFLWLPNLEGCVGCVPHLFRPSVAIATLASLISLRCALRCLPFRPVYGAQNADWLFQNWEGTTPPLGWHDTLCYLTLPLILIVVQSISQRLLTPPQDPVRALSRLHRFQQSLHRSVARRNFATGRLIRPMNVKLIPTHAKHKRCECGPSSGNNG